MPDVPQNSALNLFPLAATRAFCKQVDEDAPVPAPEPTPEPTPEPVVEVAAEPSPFSDDPFGSEPFGEFADVDMEEGAIAKEALKAEIADGMTGGTPDKAVVGEILLALEAQNPTRSPATSALLNGKWKFLYASGASPGLKALQLVLKGSLAAGQQFQLFVNKAISYGLLGQGHYMKVIMY